MADEEWFSPWVIDRANGSQVSGPDLGHWGEQSIIDPAWDALHSSKNAAEFYRAAAFLVFHARHLDPTEHASLAKLLREPLSYAAADKTSPNAIKKSFQRSQHRAG